MSELFSHSAAHDRLIARLLWWLEQSAFALLLTVVGLLPWMFSAGQLDVVELPKQTFLIVSAGLVWFLLVLADALYGSWRIVWDRYSKIMIGVVVVLGLLALGSRDPYGSWVGITKQIPTAVLTMMAGAAWWLAIRRLIITPIRLCLVLGVLTISSGVFAWGTLAWLLGHPIWPWSLSFFRTITPAGTVSETAIMLLPAMIVALLILLQGSHVFGRVRSQYEHVLRIGAGLVLVPGFLLIGAVGSPVLWFALALGSKYFFFLMTSRRERIIAMAATVFFLTCSVLSLFSPSWDPWRKLSDRISLTVPAEVTLSASVSWSMALKGFTQDPVLGRGAGTWIQLFLQERDPALNQSPFANVRFFQASSSAATALGTMGIIGILAMLVWLFLPFTVLSRKIKATEESALAGWKPLLLGIWLALVVLWFGLSLSLVPLFFLWLVSALLLNTHHHVMHPRHFHFDHPTKGMVPLTIAVLATFVCSWVGMQRFLAERLFVAGKQSLEARDYPEAERRLALAHAWNPWTDVYTSLYAQAYAQEARAQLAQNPPASQLPRITMLLSRAERLNAQARLQNPDRVESWLAAASIASTRDALIPPMRRSRDDLAALIHAQSLDPSNPQTALLIANTYLDRAENAQAWLESKDETIKTEARLLLDESSREANSWFMRADQLHPNLQGVSAGKARLALLKGDIEAAIRALEDLQQQGYITQEVRIQTALLYEQAGKADLATRLFEAIIKDHPSDPAPLARWSLARLYALNGRLDDALRLLEGLAKQFPKESIIQQQLGELRQARLEQDRALMKSATPTTTSVVPQAKKPATRRR